MTNNPHIGSSLDDLLEEDGVLEEVEAIAKKRVLAWQSKLIVQRVKIRVIEADAWQSNQSKLIVQRVKVGDMEVDGFMLPDNSYRMSQTQAAECIGLGVQNASDFLRSKAIKRLLGESYTPQTFEIESTEQLRGQSRIKGLPLEIVSTYWLWQSYRGNKQALALCMALIIESLERRFDYAFGVSLTERERDKSLPSRIEQLECDLSNLGEVFAMDDQI